MIDELFDVVEMIDKLSDVSCYNWYACHWVYKQKCEDDMNHAVMGHNDVIKQSWNGL